MSRSPGLQILFAVVVLGGAMLTMGQVLGADFQQSWAYQAGLGLTAVVATCGVVACALKSIYGAPDPATLAVGSLIQLPLWLLLAALFASAVRGVVESKVPAHEQQQAAPAEGEGAR